MVRRERRVYWVKKPEEKDLLIFDGGYSGGDIHVYEYKETVSSKKIEEEMKAHLKYDEFPEEAMKEIVRWWVEKNFGHTLSYDLPD